VLVVQLIFKSIEVLCPAYMPTQPHVIVIVISLKVYSGEQKWAW